MNKWHGLLAGLAAGAAGTTALNAVTYLDMATRGRPTSSTPEDTAEKLAAKAGIEIPGDDVTRTNRLAGLGPMSGLAAGLGVGSVLGLARSLGFRPTLPVAAVVTGVAAMAGADAPMAALGVTDPSTWAITDWFSDACRIWRTGWPPRRWFKASTEADLPHVAATARLGPARGSARRASYYPDTVGRALTAHLSVGEAELVLERGDDVEKPVRRRGTRAALHAIGGSGVAAEGVSIPEWTSWPRRYIRRRHAMSPRGAGRRTAGPGACVECGER